MNVMILTGRFGMGHYSVSKALREQIAAAYPNANVTVADLFTETFGSNTALLYKAYTFFISRGGKIYNQIYTRSERGEKTVGIPAKPLFLHALRKLLAREQCDVVISTLPFTCQIMGEYKRRYHSALPMITCITDVCTHGDWICDQTDAYLVAAEQTRQMLQSQGVDPARVFVTGVPVRAAFQPGGEKRADGVRELLIMGGGLGLMPKKKEFYEELNALENVHTTVICGDNRELLQQLNGRYANIAALGFVPDVERYLRSADLMVSKPGGVTLFETIACRVPMLAFHPFLAQEVRNGEFLENHSIGKVMNSSAVDCVPEIAALIGDGAQLAAMRRNMDKLAQERDAGALARLLEPYLSADRCA